MKFLYKTFLLFFLIFTFSLFFSTQKTEANDPIPQLLLECSETRKNEFDSTRPYQAAPCGNAPQALFCSNKLVVFEDFDLSNYCQQYKSKTNRTFDCSLDHYVQPHNINITLDESEFPIMGNTEDQLDDATKVNEYANWYLNGVIDKKENEEATDEQIVNFSGPVRKLIPYMIQDQQRIDVINSTKTISTSTPAPAGGEENENTGPQPENHDQIVVKDKRLSFWLGDLSVVRTILQSPIGNAVSGALFGATGQFLNQQLQNIGIEVGSDAWNLCRPPLPWDDGTTESLGTNVTTGETTSTPRPFESQILYQKAYNEWLGKTCVILPVVGLQCVDNPIISNDCANLWQFVPLSNNSDKKGKNYLLTGDGPSYVPSNGTEIEGAQHESYRNAPLYFAHTQEVNDLSELLNTTYQPSGYESEPLSETTEKLKKGTSSASPKPGNTVASHDPYSSLDCSAVNVRVNPGDDLFPGDRNDKKELYVQGIEYHITQVKCDEVFEPPTINGCGPEINGVGILPCKGKDEITCYGEVGIEFKLGTQTPFANEIFSGTVADSGSTFRKIFPKVEEGAPVECIADIPTQTGVTYALDPNLTEPPTGGTQELKTTTYPADSAASDTQLTFPHIGSIYEYFLNGIQTALRPKGYGTPIANGNCKPTNSIACGELPEGLAKASGSCNLGGVSSRIGDIPDSLKEIVSSAAETYKTQPNLILGVLFGEGVFNRSDKNGNFSRFDWTDENVKNWASCEPLPNCSGPATSLVSFVSDSNWQKIADKIGPDLKKVDPNKTTPDPCNLIDVIYGIAWNLHDSADGGMDFKCFGLDLKSTTPTDCSWNDNQIISAIKVFENGYERGCFTKENSCALGGGYAALCGPGGGINPDTCETVKNRYSSQPSHMGCVFDVAHGK